MGNRYRSLLCCGTFALVLFCGTPAGALSAEKLPKASKEPQPASRPQQELILQGVALHDRGDFDGAVRKYDQVLDESTDVVEAIYEKAFSMSANSLCMKAMDVARHGAEYRSPLLANFHMVLANCLDDLGRRAEAIDTFKAAIKISPKFGLLHYNLALAYIHAEMPDEARKELERSLLLNSEHASSHFLLAMIYQGMGYRVPAIMAASRFLLLEPQSQRAEDAILRINELLLGSVVKDEKTGNLTLKVPLANKVRNDEGDFLNAEVALSMSIAGAPKLLEDSKWTPFALLAGTFKMMSGSMSKGTGKGFAASYYAPFFAGLRTRDFTDAFVYQTFFAAEVPGAEEWLQGHGSQLREFRLWTLSYRWPEKKS